MNRGPGEAEWSFPQVLIAFGAGFVVAIIAATVVLSVVGEDLSVAWIMVLIAFQQGASFTAMVVMARMSGSTRSLKRAYGLSVSLRDWWAVPAGFGLQIGVVLVTAPLLQLLFPDGPPQQQVAEIASRSSALIDAVLVIAMVAVVSPIVEEMIFRGMLLGRLRRSMSDVWAVVVSGAVFAGIHLLDPNAIAAVPGLFIIGVVLGWMAVRQGNLSRAILTHVGVNLTAALLLIFGDEIAEWAERIVEDLEQVEAVIRLFV